MPIGNYYSKFTSNRAASLIYKLLGIPDLHSHLRLKPVTVFFEKYFSTRPDSAVKILEIGCGMGINAFEAEKIARKNNIEIKYTGVDLSEGAVAGAKKISESITGIKGKFFFYHMSASDFLKGHEDFNTDVILLIDIIEHIKNPQEIILLLNRISAVNGFFLISVPTASYLKFFGARCNARVGHVAGGYSETQLDSPFPGKDYQKILLKYNTGFLSNIACWLNYNIFGSGNKYFNFFKFFVLYPFTFLDFYNNSRVSCSLFAVYKKT